MSNMDIAKAENNLSLTASNTSHELESEHLIRNRDRVVAKIVPAKEFVPVSARIGVAKNEPFLIDDDAFDAMDDEIAEMFGAQMDTLLDIHVSLHSLRANADDDVE